MELEFYGAARTVTGSLHRVRAGGLDIVLDCGLFQGRRAEALERNRKIPDFARDADCLILSHAHIDHSGNIPTLVKRGFEGNIYCTPATRDLVAVMLQDSAYIQEQDAKFLNKRRARKRTNRGETRNEAGETSQVEALYTVQDALRSLDHIISVPYGRTFRLNKQVSFTFYDAGHILGSALVCITETFGNRDHRLLFTGDLGRQDMPILRDPVVVDGIDTLIMESTYGDRSHEPRPEMDALLAEEIRRVADVGGKILIPSFALERSQELLLSLHRLEEAGLIPVLPVYLDSPLAIAVTDVFRLHPECFDEELTELAGDRRRTLFATRDFVRVRSREESMAVMAREESAVIIAGSGMCENGRIVHHLANGLGKVENTVLLVGFQAENTLGRRLRDGERRVKIFGEEREVRARVRSLEGFSAHADSGDLRRYAGALARSHHLKDIFLVHGEERAARELAAVLKADGLSARISIPARGDSVSLSSV
ncbi:MAG: MBL fold metallo-hydrolase [Leptospirales bacterium]|jgi:metallo-beta-lactamase family protein